MAVAGKALVLGGGGVTGVAWEIGLLHGLAERGVDLTDAGLFVGTSAGSSVAAQVLSGVPLNDLFEAQLAGPGTEVAARMGLGGLLAFAVAGLWPGDPARGRAWLGRRALRARTMPEAQRREVIARRISEGAWPATDLRIVAVEAPTGRVRVFDASSGVPLIDAVAASCAVPLTWPPVTIGGVRHIDGGVRSVANVDLAAGNDRVVVIAPVTAAARRSGRPAAQLAALGPDVRGALVSPDRAARAAIGRNVLDPARRRPAAEAGYAQAAREAGRLRPLWT
ncbi:putative patatin-like phospholipase [Actinoplanes missouriensis 431]|uniref:Putative patatin-like phospholipase n=1 Tax=Actinoplanes missouriensis (strain ATCC 14538 / DSM 43046 / CBS 188.64 / JCM 3121 / NBRC 102363 / NCIMB 12654 / NRRL B-3342 / UNCC 431) TaxID=512565 RepID=I0H972_ACTM4|nr:patatin-like phospholipase family protein [Actinoplanes missouriensis]BAL89559.1 putative patatin-like phospholipase [Actinoplanes missouriensis 431]